MGGIVQRRVLAADDGAGIDHVDIRTFSEATTNRIRVGALSGRE
jgi:hypothetical protein